MNIRELLRKFEYWCDDRVVGLVALACIVGGLLALVGLYTVGRFVLGVIIWATWCGLSC